MKGIIMAIVNFFRSLFGATPALQPLPDVVSAPSTTGNKYAVLVGINKYVALEGSDLNGCVNDVNGVYEFLTTKRGFDPDNIRMICDERATQQAILERLEWLVSVAKPGDQLVFQYSGHGTEVRIRVDGKLEPEMCQCICPTDMDWDNLLSDKIMASYFKRIPQSAFLTYLSDSCHSGTQDRTLVLGNPHPRKVRYLAPPIDIAVRSQGRELAKNRLGWKALTGPTGNVTVIESQRHMLMSGCRDDQTSADAYIDGKYQGAMTASLMRAMNNAPEANWLDLHKEMLSWLKDNGYDQVPQLSGPNAHISLRPFA
jgi:metacaspase-1